MRKFTQARYYYRKASHLSPQDDKLYYKIAVAYMMEANWENAVKSIASALKINKNSAEYYIGLGQCYLELGKNKDALIQFMSALRIKPQGVTTWQEFIRALYVARFFDEATVQLDEAEQKLGRKPVFLYYRAAVLLATGRTKEGLLQLETALQLAPRQLKKMVELDPTLLQHNSVVELIARYRKKKK